jgi:hypothetical protein
VCKECIDDDKHSAGASGWNDAAVGHVIDIHDYGGVNPAKPSGKRASVNLLPSKPFLLASKCTLGLWSGDLPILEATYLQYCKPWEVFSPALDTNLAIPCLSF